MSVEEIDNPKPDHLKQLDTVAERPDKYNERETPEMFVVSFIAGVLMASAVFAFIMLFH